MLSLIRTCKIPFGRVRFMSSLPRSVPMTVAVGDRPTSEVQEHIDYLRTSTHTVPMNVGGEWKNFNPNAKQACPYDKSTVALYNRSRSNDELNNILDDDFKRYDGFHQWSRASQEYRNSVFRDAADLIDTKYRAKITAATIYGQAKTPYEAEIDVNELVDFARFDVAFMERIVKEQPESYKEESEYNVVEYNSLPGFVASITPFNFTAIGGHLALAPLLAGNNVVWKPSDNAVLSNYYVAQAFIEAGVPQDAFSFVTVDPEVFRNVVMNRNNISALAFTGSSKVLEQLYYYIASRIHKYDTFPRIIGETGGKNFHLVLPDADPEYAASETVKSAFGYSGQKCSACSRLYIPKSLENDVIDHLVRMTKELKFGSPEDGVFSSALINDTASERIRDFLATEIENGDYDMIYGEKDDVLSNIIKPKIILSKNPYSELMTKELFAPILGIHVYDDTNPNWTRIAKMVRHTPYGLTGSIFTSDEELRDILTYEFRNVTGNFYVNTKSTGSMVGRQPFGGGRKSGTNDKAGSMSFMHRFLNQRTIKYNIE